jgi:hypothetical protein
MALIKKRDVPSYFAQRKRKGMLLGRSTSQPDATGFSGGAAGTASIKPIPPAKNLAPQAVPGPTDFSGQHVSRNAEP